MEIQNHHQQNGTYRIFLLSCTVSINLRLFFAIVGPSVTSRPGILRFDWRLFTEQLFHIRKVYLDLRNFKNIFTRTVLSRIKKYNMKEKLCKFKINSIYLFLLVISRRYFLPNIVCIPHFMNWKFVPVKWF